MESIISTFHLNTGLLVAQVINFAIVVLVLWYFAFRPLNKKMTERQTEIKDSLVLVEKTKTDLELANKERESILKEARVEAKKIMTEAVDRAEAKNKESLLYAKEEVSRVIAEGKEKLTEQKRVVVAEAQKEIGSLVTLSVERILSQLSSEKADRTVIDKIVKKL